MRLLIVVVSINLLSAKLTREPEMKIQDSRPRKIVEAFCGEEHSQYLRDVCGQSILQKLKIRCLPRFDKRNFVHKFSKCASRLVNMPGLDFRLKRRDAALQRHSSRNAR